MEAIIVSYRGGRRTQNTNQMLIHVSGVDSKEKAQKLVGKAVTWHAPGKNKKVLTGKITGVHGRKGILRTLFEKGLPGQSLGEKIKIA